MLVYISLCLQIILPYKVHFMITCLTTPIIFNSRCCLHQQALILVLPIELRQVNELLILNQLLEAGLQLTLTGGLDVEVTAGLEQELVRYLLLGFPPQIEREGTLEE